MRRATLQHTDLAADATVAAIANKVTVGAGGIAFLGGLSANEFAAFGGLGVAAGGLAIQWFYKRRADRRAEELHRRRLTGLREEQEDV